MIHILKIKCPECGAGTNRRDVAGVINHSAMRFTLCDNDHIFNKRPYTDYDQHYIFEDKIDKERF